jgi:hypothetical protein
MQTLTPEEFFNRIDGPLFLQQRQLLNDLLSAAAVPLDVRLTPAQVELLEGLGNLLDNLADIAHDRFAFGAVPTVEPPTIVA